MRGGDPFAGKAEWFDEGYRTTAHGQLQLQLVMDRLVPKLPPPASRILDAGGGTGAFAVRLARLGCEVTILDSSGEWLEVARRSAAEAGVSLQCVEGAAQDAPDLVEGRFDAGAQRVRNLEVEPFGSLLIAEGEDDQHVAVSIEGCAALHTGEDARRILDDWLRRAWGERYGSALEWAETIIEIVPTKVLSHKAS